MKMASKKISDREIVDIIFKEMKEHQEIAIENKSTSNNDQSTDITLTTKENDIAYNAGRVRVRAAFIESVITLLTRKGLVVKQYTEYGKNYISITLPAPVMKTHFNGINDLIEHFT